jgi:fermentation-respiration switch protein FrsA (DUF1100 family)
MRRLLDYAFRRRRLPAAPMLLLAEAMNRWRYGYTYGAVEPIEVVAAIAPRPLLLVHGAADSTIPVEHSQALFAAAGEPKELWIVPGIEHCGVYFAGRQTYVSRVAGFFEHALGAVPSA